jgi:FixH
VVDEKYYESELKFQEKIDASKNLANLSENLVITNNKEELVIQFPKEAVSNNTKGKIVFLNALQNSYDVSIAVNTVNGIQSINKNKLAKGTYFLKIDWVNNGVAYYHQQNINIQ